MLGSSSQIKPKRLIPKTSALSFKTLFNPFIWIVMITSLAFLKSYLPSTLEAKTNILSAGALVM